MIKTRLKYICSIITVLCCAVFIFSFKVSAVSVFYLSGPEGSSALVTADELAIEALELTQDEQTEDACLFLEYSGGEATGYYFNRAFYNSLSNKDKRKVMHEFVAALKSQVVNTADTQVIYNSLKEADDKFINAEVAALLNSSGASMYSAFYYLRPFTSKIGLVLGIITILLILLMLVSTVLDLALLSGLADFLNADMSKRPKFMSLDAYKALKIATDTNSNVYWVYFKRRVWTYVIFAFCIIYLASGKIGDLFVSLFDMV